MKLNHIYPKPRAAKGFSLIEAMVGAVVLVLVMLVSTGFFKDVLSELRVISISLDSQAQTRKALKFFSAEVRSATPSSLGSYPIEQAASTSLIFYCNLDQDGYVERIRYYKDGTELKKGVLKPSGNPLSYDPGAEIVTTMLEDLSNTLNPIFSYYDSTYAGTSSPLAEPVNISSVRLIKAYFEIDSNPADPPAALIMTTQVSLRNLKDNQ